MVDHCAHFASKISSCNFCDAKKNSGPCPRLQNILHMKRLTHRPYSIENALSRKTYRFDVFSIWIPTVTELGGKPESRSLLQVPAAERKISIIFIRYWSAYRRQGRNLGQSFLRTDGVDARCTRRARDKLFKDKSLNRCKINVPTLRPRCLRFGGPSLQVPVVVSEFRPLLFAFSLSACGLRATHRDHISNSARGTKKHTVRNPGTP